mgnify:CR=1 FL=1
MKKMKAKAFLGLIVITIAMGVPLFAGSARPEPAAVFTNAMTRLNQEASVDADAAVQLADLIRKEYGTREDDLRWALQRSMGWGEITALAYIQATTGRSFAEIVQQTPQSDFLSYADNAGMNCEKMTHSLEKFLKRAERERNSRIFERLRSSRRVQTLPDLGSGFGLFQEALDFRRIDSPRPTKVHDGSGVLAKGEK